MTSDSCYYFLSGITNEAIVTKIKGLDGSLLGYELYKKVNIAGFFLLSLRMLKPRWVSTEIKSCDLVNVRAEKGF